MTGPPTGPVPARSPRIASGAVRRCASGRSALRPAGPLPDRGRGTR